jgi:hypothetical protein
MSVVSDPDGLCDPSIVALRAALESYVPIAGGDSFEDLCSAFVGFFEANLPDGIADRIFPPADGTKNVNVTFRFTPLYYRYVAVAAEEVKPFMRRFGFVGH